MVLLVGGTHSAIKLECVYDFFGASFRIPNKRSNDPISSHRLRINAH